MWTATARVQHMRVTGVARRRRFTTEQRLAVVAETMQAGMSISYVARRHGPRYSVKAADDKAAAQPSEPATR